MKSLTSLVMLSCFSAILLTAAENPSPKIVFENTPESGIPSEAQAQERIERKDPGSISQLLGDSVASVRVRYFNDHWKNEKEVSAYLAGLFTDQRNQAYSRQPWSQGVGVPEIECLITFKDHREGRLLLWQSVACIRDSAGQWWFVTIFDHYHSHHPKGDRALSRRANRSN